MSTKIKRIPLTYKKIPLDKFVELHSSELPKWFNDALYDGKFNRSSFAVINDMTIIEEITNTTPHNTPLEKMYAFILSAPALKFITLSDYLERVKKLEKNNWQGIRSYDLTNSAESLIKDSLARINKNDRITYYFPVSHMNYYDTFDLKTINFFIILNDFFTLTDDSVTYGEHENNIGQSLLKKFLKDGILTKNSFTSDILGHMKSRSFVIPNPKDSQAVLDIYRNLTLKEFKTLLSSNSVKKPCTSRNSRKPWNIQMFLDGIFSPNNQGNNNPTKSQKNEMVHNLLLSFFMKSYLGAKNKDKINGVELSRLSVQLIQNSQNQGGEPDTKLIILEKMHENCEEFTLEESVGLMYFICRATGILSSSNSEVYSVVAKKMNEFNNPVNLLKIIGEYVMSSNEKSFNMTQITGITEDISQLPMNMAINLLPASSGGRRKTSDIITIKRTLRERKI